MRLIINHIAWFHDFNEDELYFYLIWLIKLDNGEKFLRLNI